MFVVINRMSKRLENSVEQLAWSVVFSITDIRTLI